MKRRKQQNRNCLFPLFTVLAVLGMLFAFGKQMVKKAEGYYQKLTGGELSMGTLEEASESDEQTDEKAKAQIEDAIRNCRETVAVSVSSADRLKEIMREVMADPAFFYLTGEYTYSGFSDFGKYSVTMNYKYSDVDSKIKELETVTAGVISQLTDEISDYQKILRIHDWICENTSYQKMDDGSDQDIYGAIVNGKAVCGGYAKAFAYLCEQAGITAKIYYGDADSNGEVGSHAWNSVTLDGQEYYYDVTWDDTDEAKNSRYYFGVTSSEMAKSHFPNDPMAESTATEQNYYYMNGYVLFSYSEENLLQIVDRQYSDNIEIKCVDEDVYHSLIDCLRNGNAFFNVMKKAGIYCTHYSYTMADDVLCVTICCED